MILDATAGNRTMWKHKNTENIIYIDIEKKLERKPTIFADNTNTPFLSGIFDTIFYDPPHGWDVKGKVWIMHAGKHDKDKKRANPFSFDYYGWDKYRSRANLLNHIYKAQKEFMRILKPDGLLWLKWNETRIPLRRMFMIFDDWTELIRLVIEDPSQTLGNKQTYWICLIKEKRETTQTALG